MREVSHATSQSIHPARAGPTTPPPLPSPLSKELALAVDDLPDVLRSSFPDLAVDWLASVFDDSEIETVKRCGVLARARGVAWAEESRGPLWARDDVGSRPPSIRAS